MSSFLLQIYVILEKKLISLSMNFQNIQQGGQNHEKNQLHRHPHLGW